MGIVVWVGLDSVRVRKGMAWKMKCLKQHRDFVEFMEGWESFAFGMVLRVGLRLDLITTGWWCERVYYYSLKCTHVSMWHPLKLRIWWRTKHLFARVYVCILLIHQSPVFQMAILERGFGENGFSCQPDARIVLDDSNRHFHYLWLRLHRRLWVR